MTDQVFNEPIATGWLRTELRGDIDTAKGYVMDARKLLGGMRIAFGVNQRIADGEAGGFYQLSRQLPDGSVMQAITNNGQDTIRITTRSAQQQSSADAPLTGTASKSTVQGESHSFVATHEDGPIPVPVLTSKTEEEGEEKREEEDPQPYMWVGARVRVDLFTDPNNQVLSGSNPSVPWTSLIIFVAEPGQNGVVANPSAMWGGSNVGIAPLDLTAQDANWAQYYPWVGADRFQYSANINAIPRQFINNTTINFTKHLLRQYGSEYIANRDDALAFGPFDPLEQPGDYDNRMVQIVNGVKNQYSLWDQVAVLDPYEGIEEPTSHRQADADSLSAIQAALASANMPMSGESMVLPGGYQIFIGATGPDCATAPGIAYGWNEQNNYYPEPLPVEVEVRVGKAPDTVTQRFQVMVPRYSSTFENLWPFGDQSQTGACPLNGANPHGSNWWPGVITADPTALTISSADTYQQADVFGNVTEHSLCSRIPWDIYVQIFQPYSNYASGSYPTAVTTQVWALLQQAWTGQFGSVSIPQRTQAQVQTAAEAVIALSGSEGLYHYDVETNIFTPVPTPPEDPTLTYDASSYRTWEYTYRWQSLRACRTFGKVRLGQGDPVFWGYTFYGDPLDVMNMNCCADPGHPMP